ncbi:hypothetical protein [Lactococcus muris]|uniref:hypothetical protein n=1 Tax=Lactococcus muris TaxID=2941330 RepID=UPI002300EC35
MELEKLVMQHDDKLKQHDKELDQMRKNMDESLTRVDESNRFLREQNTRQSEQNTEILQAILNRNHQADIRDYEMKMLDKQNLWKAIFGIGSTVGLIVAAAIKLFF